MNNNYLKKIFCGIVFFASSLQAVPAALYFMRHGEKSHNEKNINLNTRGYSRACALTALFVDMPLVGGGELPKNVIYKNSVPFLPAPYGQPAGIYAKAQKHTHSAVRAIMTVHPIAEKLSLNVIPYDIEHDHYDIQDPKKFEHCYLKLVQEVIHNPDYDAKAVLICWEHNALPTVMQAFLTECSDKAILHHDLKDPKIFKDFDRIIRFSFKKDTIKTIDNNSQELLYGDASSSTNKSYKVKGKHVELIKK